MKRLLISRLVWALPLVLSVVVANFLLARLVPGDPMVAIVGEYPVPAEYAAQIRKDLKLDEPLYIQLGSYLSEVAHGNLGYSFVNRQSVASLVLTRACATLMLLVPSLILATIVGVLLAWIAAVRRRGKLSTALTVVTLFGYSVPVFWLGQMLIIVFAVGLHWLPAQGMLSTRGAPGPLGVFGDFALHWLMPGISVAIFHMAVVARIGRASLQESMSQDFVTTARAKGQRERKVFVRHILPNGLIPVITVVGNSFGHALTGTIMVETVFGWPGLGTLFINSISSRDYPVVQGIFLLSAIAVVLINLLTDVIYGLVDPRIRHGYTRAH